MAKVFEFPKYEPKPKLRRAPFKVLTFKAPKPIEPVFPLGAIGAFWLGGLA